MDIKEEVIKGKIPQHVAIIMDGNGRWAKMQGKHRIFGHSAGVESVREALVAASEIGVKYLTLYAFSTENWNRPKEEVDGLMDLLVQTISNEVESLNKNEVRLQSIGDPRKLPNACSNELQNAIEKTAHNKRINLILALNYSAKWEIANACKKIAQDIKANKIDVDDITDDLINQYLTTNNIPEPELLIRTSGEKRISNFLLWQIAYTELYFTDIFWPDFKKESFYEAILDYQSRERRFGKVSEQIQDAI